jgi:hypothetical protein
MYDVNVTQVTWGVERTQVCVVPHLFSVFSMEAVKSTCLCCAAWTSQCNNQGINKTAQSGNIQGTFWDFKEQSGHVQGRGNTRARKRAQIGVCGVVVRSECVYLHRSVYHSMLVILSSRYTLYCSFGSTSYSTMFRTLVLATPVLGFGGVRGDFGTITSILT